VPSLRFPAVLAYGGGLGVLMIATVRRGAPCTSAISGLGWRKRWELASLRQPFAEAHRHGGDFGFGLRSGGKLGSELQQSPKAPPFATGRPDFPAWAAAAEGSSGERTILAVGLKSRWSLYTVVGVKTAAVTKIDSQTTQGNPREKISAFIVNAT